MKVAFLLDSFLVGGGVGVVIEYCVRLSRMGVETFIVTDKPGGRARDWHPAAASLAVLTYDEASAEKFDVAIATLWKTCYDLPRVRARRYAYLVQSIETRFYAPGADSFLKPIIAATYHFPVAFITEAKWIRDYLMGIRPSAQVFYVKNGIDKTVFQPSSEGPPPKDDGPLRILIEGPLGVWFKETEKAIEIASVLPFSKQVTLVTAYETCAKLRKRVDEVKTRLRPQEMAELYRNHDVLLKLSKVEGMFGPPLEAFHCGATAICSQVTGADEYMVHGWNGLLTAPGDYDSARRYLTLLNDDRRLLQQLKNNALSTAQGWPSWEQSAELLSAVLHNLAAAAPVESYASLLVPRLLQQGVDMVLTGGTARAGVPSGDHSRAPSTAGMMRLVVRLYRLGLSAFRMYDTRPLRLLRRLLPAKAANVINKGS